VNQFDYLAVLVSIVLGLGIANVLTGFAAIVRARARVTSFLPTYVQMANVFVIHIQLWWAMFGLREVRHWTFPIFLAVILQPVLVFLMSAFIVPDVPRQGAVDLKEQYFREHAWFGAALFATVADSLLRNVLVSGRLPSTPELVAHGVFAMLGAIGFVSRNARVHMVLAPVVSLTLAVYVGTLFFELQ
jgi:hypothetical protein